LPDVYGHDHDFNEYRAKVIRLEFIETLCPHCRAFTAILNEVETRYMNRVNIVAVVNPPDLPAIHSPPRLLPDPAGRRPGRLAYVGKPAFHLPAYS
jgi:thiol-disulfide isomerase/thioredoxin